MNVGAIEYSIAKQTIHVHLAHMENSGKSTFLSIDSETAFLTRLDIDDTKKKIRQSLIETDEPTSKTDDPLLDVGGSVQRKGQVFCTSQKVSKATTSAGKLRMRFKCLWLVNTHSMIFTICSWFRAVSNVHS